MAIPKGTKVRQKVVVIEGEVTNRRFNESSEELEYLVPHTDAHGEPCERWFLESQIEVVADDKAEGEEAAS